MNLKEAQNTVLQLIDRYSTRGKVSGAEDTNTVDYSLKIRNYLDIAQKHIASLKPIRKVFYISQKLPPYVGSMDTRQFSGTDIIVENAQAGAYHFAVDDYAEVFIEGYDGVEWQVIENISASAVNGFEAYKGLIEPTSDYANIRIRFSGTTVYNVKDVCLFSAHFSHYAKIPNYSRYISNRMPEDFLHCISAQIKTGDDYKNFDNLVWDSENVVGISYDVEGEIKIVYGAISTTITEETKETYQMEIDASLHGAMCFYAASLLFNHERPDVAKTLIQLYQEKMISYEHHRIPQKRIKRV